MKLPRYFLEHPVIAIIINCLIIVVGLLCWQNLAIREYPKITFPVISVTSFYPSASAELIESSLTAILEDQLAGIEGVENITSHSTSGISHIILNFTPGTSMEKALRMTEQQVTQARNHLPAEVLTPTISEEKEESSLPFIGLTLESSDTDLGALTHYAKLNLKNTLQTLTGVSSVDIEGQPYSYLVTLDPKKMYTYGINTTDVLATLNNSQINLPAGKFQKHIPTTIQSSLHDVRDYENLLITGQNKTPISLKSVADIQFKTDNDSTRVRVNGHTGVLIAISRSSDADPIAVSKKIHDLLPILQNSLPSNMKMHVIIDQSTFIHSSIHNVFSAIVEAIVLVLLIVLFFLRNVRATLIPLAAIPVSLLGSMIFLKLFGYSLNLMTILAMVLAVGLVVDDAIVVLENIWRHIESGMSPINAAKKGSSEIGFAIVAMTFTLASVYAPIAFMQGTIGQLFVEFSVALTGSVIISGVVALILSPLMCAQLFSEHPKQFCPRIDILLLSLTERYQQLLQVSLDKKKIIAALVVICIVASGFCYHQMPKEMSPNEDRGLVTLYTPADVSENLDAIDNKIQKIEQAVGQIPESINNLTFIGEWGANIYYPLKPLEQRTRSSAQIMEEMRNRTSQLPSIDAYPWSWESGLPGSDQSQGESNLRVQIATTESYQNLFNQVEQLKKQIIDSKKFGGAHAQLHLDTMGYAVDIDQNALARLGLTPIQVAKTIEVFFSGNKSMNFSKDGILYPVNVRGSISPWTLNELYLTTPDHQTVSLGALAKLRPQTQPKGLDHYNQLRSTTLSVQLAKGDSLAIGMKKLSVFLHDLPPSYKASWTGSAQSYNQSSNQTIYLFLLSILFIYAILAIQFESFIDPLIILVTVPLAATGALLASYLAGFSFNIFTEVGLITLIGLITKHGILIVEFANKLMLEGHSLEDAIVRAASLRLRPILMTSGAMFFGALPLLLGHQAGAEPRQALGLVLLGGLSIGTIFTLLVLPTVYLSVKRFNFALHYPETPRAAACPRHPESDAC